MESFGTDDSLDLFRRDARHRRAMCLALGEDDDAFDPIAAAAERSLAAIDAKKGEVQRAEDLLIDARAVERVMRLRAAKVYADIRRRLAVEATDIYRTILPVPPSSIGKAGIKRAVTIVERSMTMLRREETPEIVRVTHVPLLERELGRLRTADTAEDEVAMGFAALRVAVSLFKVERERERQVQYADVVKIVGKADAEQFFLSGRRSAGGGGDDGEDPVVPAPGG